MRNMVYPYIPQFYYITFIYRGIYISLTCSQDHTKWKKNQRFNHCTFKHFDTLPSETTLLLSIPCKRGPEKSRSGKEASVAQWLCQAGVAGLIPHISHFVRSVSHSRSKLHLFIREST